MDSSSGLFLFKALSSLSEIFILLEFVVVVVEMVLDGNYFICSFDNGLTHSTHYEMLLFFATQSPNLLWRLQNGELPTKLTPKIFWILIGTNDFLKDGLDHCSEDVVLMGIKRVVGELQSRKPKSTIVINGILPRAEKGREGMLYGSGSDDIDGEGGGDGNGDSAIGIMDAIDAVNAKLSEFCDTHENLHYFDGKDIFVETKEELQTEGKVVEHFIPQSLMADYLHPTSRGYQKWGRKIVDEMRSLLDGQLVVD